MPRLRNYVLNALTVCLVLYAVGLLVLVVVLFAKNYNDLTSEDYKEWVKLNEELASKNESWAGGTMRKPLMAALRQTQSESGDQALTDRPINVLDTDQHHSHGRRDVEFVLGVPIAWRKNGRNQLIDTLYTLVAHMDADERASVLIVVFIGEVRAVVVQQIVSQITANFRLQMASGLIDVITPRQELYRELQGWRLEQSNANPAGERLYWRSKRNLDCAALMHYAQTRGRYYLQLADNVSAKRNYLTYMRKTVVLQEAFQLPAQRPWLVYSFSNLGNAGKLLRAKQLTEFIQFLQIFYKDQPGDWLLAHYVKMKVCLGIAMGRVACKRNVSQAWLESTQSQFERIGNASLLGQRDETQHRESKAQRYLRLPLALARSHAMQIANTKSYAADDSDANDWQSKNEFYFWGYLPQLNGMLAHIFEHSNTRRQYHIYKGATDITTDFGHAVLDVLPPAQAAELRANQTPAGRREGFIVAYRFDTQQKHKVARAAFYALDNGADSGLWLRVMRNASSRQGGATICPFSMNFLLMLLLLVN